jgi:hypothetical protein
MPTGFLKWPNDAINAIPELWNILLGNLDRLGRRFEDDFKNTSSYGNRPLRLFHFGSVLDQKKLEKALKLGHQEIWLQPFGQVGDGVIRASSVFSLYNQIVLKPTDSRRYYICLGFYFSYQDREISCYSYVSGPGSDEKSENLDIKIDKDRDTITLPSEDRLYNSHRRLLKKALSGWIGSDSAAPEDVLQSGGRLLEACG